MGGLHCERKFKGKCELLDTEHYTSVSETIEKLKLGRIPDADSKGYCVVFSKKLWTVLLVVPLGQARRSLPRNFRQATRCRRRCGTASKGLARGAKCERPCFSAARLR